MKKKWVPLVFMIVTGFMCTISCTSILTLFDSEYNTFIQIKEDALEREHIIDQNMFLYEAVVFDLNDYRLSSNAQWLLNKKVEWLKTNPDVNVIIEGHCDNLGDSEYNLVLGKKRGNAVKTFIVKSGIDESRIKLVSFGKDRPVDFGKNEESLAKNRRVIFRFSN